MEDVAALVGCLWLTLLMATAWAVSVAKDRYQQAHRAPPTSWDELVPSPLSSPPQDPFVDGPLHLAPVGRHLVLYSVGADETDNGGTSRQLDIVFKVRGLDQ